METHKYRKECPSGLQLIQLNPVTFIATHGYGSRKDFQFGPRKIKNRLLLTDSRWCRMGTFFSLPGDFLSIKELQYLLEKMNEINREAGRLDDDDILIRTALEAKLKSNVDVIIKTDSKTVIAPNWSEPAFLVAGVESGNLKVKELSTFKKVDYITAMTETNRSWKMYHSDNIPLQEQAIHGRLELDRESRRLDLGSGVLHARFLEKGHKTTVNIPQEGYPSDLELETSFFNLDTFVPNNLTIKGHSLTKEQINDFIKNYLRAGGQLSSFMEWVSNNLRLDSYVAEFRYYTRDCKPDERFHIMDLDTNF